MSIVTDARTYADTALEQGKSTLTFAQGRLLSLTSDARERATSVADETKGLALSAVSLARRQAYAAIGATDALVASLTKRAEELPSETKHSANKLVGTTKARINLAGGLAESVTAKGQALAEKAQDKVLEVAVELKERSEDIVGSARKIDLSATAAEAKGEVDTRVDHVVGQVKATFTKLADRGEKVATDLRHDPIVTRVIGEADKAVEAAANEVTSVAQKVRAKASAVTPAPAKRAYVRKTPVSATPAPAKKVTAKKAPAKKTPAKHASA